MAEKAKERLNTRRGGFMSKIGMILSADEINKKELIKQFEENTPF